LEQSANDLIQSKIDFQNYKKRAQTVLSQKQTGDLDQRISQLEELLAKSEKSNRFVYASKHVKFCIIRASDLLKEFEQSKIRAKKLESSWNESNEQIVQLEKRLEKMAEKDDENRQLRLALEDHKKMINAINDSGKMLTDLILFYALCHNSSRKPPSSD
jgi:DNA repair exonuclease SbcCD ATPase subunit